MRLDTFPLGFFTGLWNDHSYRVVKTHHARGPSVKLVAHGGPGGTDYISVNLYRLSSCAVLLKPCELSADQVAAFVLGLTPQPPCD